MSSPVPSEVVRRRADIGDAIALLERALAKPAGDLDHWRTLVAASLTQLADLVHDQVVAYETEVFTEVVEHAPHLAGRIAKINELLDSLDGRISSLRERVPSIDPDVVREDALVVLAAIVRGRQRIADVVWDAYTIDLGGHSA